MEETNGSHFAHINLLRASHLIFPFELIKVCLNVTAIFKFPIICQQELPPFLCILYFLLYICRSHKDASTMRQGCLPSLLHKR